MIDANDESDNNNTLTNTWIYAIISAQLDMTLEIYHPHTTHGHKVDSIHVQE